MVLVLLLIGILFIGLGLSTYLGIEKFWWWSNSTPVVPTGIVFGAFPAALVFFLLAYVMHNQASLSTETKDILAFYVGIPLILFSVILTMWQPRWLKPKWLRWLETYYCSILPLLREEARKEGWQSWNERVKTQEGLEEWVAEVRRKHKLN